MIWLYIALSVFWIVVAYIVALCRGYDTGRRAGLREAKYVISAAVYRVKLSADTGTPLTPAELKLYLEHMFGSWLK